MSDYATPTAIANQALDAAGLDFTLGDLQEGTRPAQVALRAYGECLRQLLRCASWDFARREAPLLLLADASGLTPNVGTVVASTQYTYSYAYPTDCAKVRFVPWNIAAQPGVVADNINVTDPVAPLMTGLGQQAGLGQRIRPAPFLIGSDFRYVPPDVGTDQQGMSPSGRTVIMTNVANASCVYTYEALFPSVWDHQFRAAMVAYLASEIAMPLARDKKFGLTMRDRNIAIATAKIQQARLTDGNETWSSSDISVDWMRVRSTGGGYGPWGGSSMNGQGNCFGGWDAVGFANGSSF